MSVDADTVRRVAHLARIAVADDEVENLQGELNAILAFVEQLAEVDVDGVEPMTSVTPMAMKMRKDEVNDGGIADAIVANAPAREDHFFLVPKVVECMCLACEQDEIWFAYLESRGLLKPDDAAAIDALFAAFPVQPLPAQPEKGKPRADAPAEPAKNPFSCDDPTAG